MSLLLQTKEWGTGKSFSETLIFASSNPQYDNRLFMELRVQYMGRTCSAHVLSMFYAFFHGNSMNDLLSYYGLLDAKIRASDKDLPVQNSFERKLNSNQ